MPSPNVLEETMVCVTADGEEHSVAQIVVIADQVGTRKFAAFGVDGDGPYLDTDDGERCRLPDAQRRNAVTALGRDQVFVRIMTLDNSKDPEYEIDFADREPSPSPGAP